MNILNWTDTTSVLTRKSAARGKRSGNDLREELWSVCVLGSLHVCVCAHTCRWLARLWNAVVVPRVEEAIISRVTAKRSSSSTSQSPAPSSQRPCLSNCGLSAGQQAVVKAALSILVNKAVLLGCPLPRHGACASHVTFSCWFTVDSKFPKEISEQGKNTTWD